MTVFVCVVVLRSLDNDDWNDHFVTWGATLSWKITRLDFFYMMIQEPVKSGRASLRCHPDHLWCCSGCYHCRATIATCLKNVAIRSVLNLQKHIDWTDYELLLWNFGIRLFPEL